MQAYEAYLQACPGLAVGQPFDQGLLEGCFNTFSGGFRVVSHVSWLAIWFEWFEAVEPYRISSLVFIGKVENSPVQMAFGILVFEFDTHNFSGAVAGAVRNLAFAKVGEHFVCPHVRDFVVKRSKEHGPSHYSRRHERRNVLVRSE